MDMEIQAPMTSACKTKADSLVSAKQKKRGVVQGAETNNIVCYHHGLENKTK